MHLIDKSFIKNPKSYIIQSLLAVIAIAIILYFVEVLTHAAIVAALGSSTFIVFAMPHTIAAQPRRLIGGHAVGLISGTIGYYLFLNGPLGALAASWEFVTWGVYALSVGLSIFLMTITNTEHSPAAGTASLAIIRRLLRRYLKDLF